MPQGKNHIIMTLFVDYAVCAACRALVFQSGIVSGSWSQKHQVLTAQLPGNSLLMVLCCSIFYCAVLYNDDFLFLPLLHWLIGILLQGRVGCLTLVTCSIIYAVTSTWTHGYLFYFIGLAKKFVWVFFCAILQNKFFKISLFILIGG